MSIFTLSSLVVYRPTSELLITASSKLFVISPLSTINDWFVGKSSWLIWHRCKIPKNNSKVTLTVLRQKCGGYRAYSMEHSWKYGNMKLKTLGLHQGMVKVLINQLHWLFSSHQPVSLTTNLCGTCSHQLIVVVKIQRLETTWVKEGAHTLY